MVFKEASYGGAYDIEDDMYFTKEDLLEFTDELIDTLQDKGIFVDLVDMYITDGNRLVIAVEDEDGNEIDTDEFIDMRKIRRPKDIYKYKDIFIKDILSQHNEFKSLNEDSDEIPIVDRLNFINKRGNGMPGIANINEFIDCLNAVGKDKFMVKETKAGSNLSLADLKDEWMTLKRKGWKWYTKSLPHEFLNYYVFEKTNDNDIQIKENIDESDNDIDITSDEAANKLADEFQEYCLKKHVFIEECEGQFDSDDNLVISYEIYDGDWKHEHLATKFLAKEFFFKKGYTIRDVNEYMIDEDGSDTYSAHYDIEFANNSNITPEKINKGENMKENLVEDDLQQLKAEIENEVEKYMTSEGFEPDEVKEYSAVDVYFDSKERDRVIVEVRAELSYDGLFELGLRLDKIVANYDEDAYFEPEEPGITTAYIYNITPEKTNKRSKQIKKGLDIKEIYENNPNYINDLYELLIQAQVTIDKIRENYSSDVYDIIKLGIEQNLDEFMAHDDDGWTMYAAIKEAHKSPEDDEDDNYYDESYDEDEDDDYHDEDDENNNYPKNLPEQFYSLYDKLNGDFWTRKDELKQDIEEINDPEYSVEELNDEYVIVTDPEDDMHALQIFNGGTERTYVLDFDRIRYL